MWNSLGMTVVAVSASWEGWAVAVAGTAVASNP